MRIFFRVPFSALAVCTALTLFACSGDSGDDGIAGADGKPFPMPLSVKVRNTCDKNNGVGSPSQKVNYPIEVLRSRDGLCIETTHLFASIFEALGMQPVIVEIPGHAFVGWRTDLNSNIVDFLETTMIANKNATFTEALNKGNSTFDAEKEAGNFDTGVSSFVDVEQTRIYGVRPNNIP